MAQKKFFSVLCLISTLHWVNSNPVLFLDKLRDATVSSCQSCHSLDDKKINVHLVPHSHDDVGWLKTVNQYYIGTGDFTGYDKAGVKYILDSTVKALQDNKERRYIQVETAYFWKWWQNQSNETKNSVKSLVESGQMEIINGAWSMNDEAATNYQSIIDQFTWGFRILEKHLGKCAQPIIGWQIDPFGHSREHASLMKQFGFQGLVIGRLDHLDKEKRIQEKNLDFNWKSNSNFDDSTLFTTIFPHFYNFEEEFCLDSTCGYGQKTINDDNLAEKVYQFEKLLDKYREYFQTNNILIPMGGDFTYQLAEENFLGIEKLMKGFKNNANYSLFYSTPTCYIKAVTDFVAKQGIQLKEKTDDFFPYSSDKNSFWTGYFTSRPTSKRFERVGNNILQSAKQLMTFSRINGEDYGINIIALREAMGIMQHHDAITGTEKQAVADDYARILDAAIKKAEEPMGTIIGNLLRKNKTERVDLKLASCLLSNVSICATTQKDKFLVAVQNPLSRTVTHYVRLPVDGDSYNITGPDGPEEYDIFDAIHDFAYIKESTAPSSKELVFAARNLPPLGIKLYYIEKIASAPQAYVPFVNLKDDDGIYGNANNGFAVNTTTNKLISVTINGITKTVTQEFLYYSGAKGYSKASGAYIFRPYDKYAKPLTIHKITSTAARGKLVDEFKQIVCSEVYQIIRVYKNNESYIEFDWLVGDLHVNDGYGNEVISRFKMEGLTNNGVFYTDSNGRQLVKREKDKRADYTYNATIEPVASNYYPITSKIVIKDDNLELAVLNDRAQGGSSLKDGTIEIMVHRRLVNDDGFGVNEVLNEVQYGKGLFARGQHYLTFGTPDTKFDADKSIAAYERNLAQSKLLAPLVLLADATTSDFDSLDKVQNLVQFKFEGLKRDLPDNVQILTLDPWMDSYILRLEHILEKDEDEKLSKDVEVDLNNLFTLYNITEIMETPLGANSISQNSEYEWKEISNLDELKITLKPSEIKTFLIKTNKNNEGGNDDRDPDSDDDDGKGSATLNTATCLIVFISCFYAVF